MDDNDRADIVLPSDELGAVMARARAAKLRGGSQTEEPEPEAYAPLEPVSAPQRHAAPHLDWLPPQARANLDNKDLRPMVTSLLSWAGRVSGRTKTRAVFHTRDGRVIIPVLQSVSSNNDSVLVLMLDPDRLSFFPEQGIEIMFGMEYDDRGPSTPEIRTVLSGPWSMPGFPVAFLLLWDQNAGMQPAQEHTMTKDARDTRAPMLRMAETEDEREALSKYADPDDEQPQP